MRCDGKKDCENGEDEMLCGKIVRLFRVMWAIAITWRLLFVVCRPSLNFKFGPLDTGPILTKLSKKGKQCYTFILI
jgi:hypothetical protein